MKTFACVMPEREEDRVRLRRLLEGGPPLPARYAGASIGECEGCALLVEVPPRIAAALLSDPTMGLVCPWCAAVASASAAHIGLISLDNPESRPEAPPTPSKPFAYRIRFPFPPED